MKKIGILTYFWADNPGTFLQAFSTLQVLQSWFPSYQVELIDIKIRHPHFKLKRIHVNPFVLLEDLHRYFIYCRLQRKDLPKSPSGFVTLDYDTATRYIEKQNYDAVIVGADTVLQLLRKHFTDRQPPVYWLSPRLNCKKIALASSAGTLTSEQLDNDFKERFSRSIQAFDLVGVRDDITFQLMEQLGLKGTSKLERVQDPTFVFDIDYQLIDRFLKRKGFEIRKKSIGICLPLNLELTRRLIEYYRKKGFQLVGLSYNRHADLNFMDISPFEWAGIYRYFSLTVTDRFHGSVFSLKNGTPVMAVDCTEGTYTQAGWSKKSCLLKEFHLDQTNHINTGSMTDIDQILQRADSIMETFDGDAVRQKIDEFRGRFHRFLNRMAKVLEA